MADDGRHTVTRADLEAIRASDRNPRATRLQEPPREDGQPAAVPYFVGRRIA
jgi:hypothetical protein